MGQALSPETMPARTPVDRGGWSSSIGELLLASLTDDELAQHWGLHATGASELDNAVDLRIELLDWACEDDEVRTWIRDAWRVRNDCVIEAVESGSIRELSKRADWLLSRFEAEDVLIALITESDEGWQMAGAFVDGIADEPRRRTLMRSLKRLSGASAGAERCPRIVIFGGHPRYGLRFASNIAAIGPFDIRWRAFERKNHRSADDKSVAGALHDAAAAIVVAGMASHALARMVKTYAQQRSIPVRCVQKLTESQIAEALMDLFPATRLQKD